MKKRMARVFLSLCIVMVCFVAMAVTASAVTGGAYRDYLPTGTNDQSKQVTFNGKKWFIIEDNSTSTTAGTVTLFAVESFGSSIFGTSNVYSSSKVKNMLDTMVSSGRFKNVASAIKSSNLGKLYLLSKSEAEALQNSVKGTINQSWWLSTPGDINYVYIVVNDAGMGFGPGMGFGTLSSTIDKTNAVRPALQLDLSKVVFDSTNKAFSLIPTNTTTSMVNPDSMPKTGDNSNLLFYAIAGIVAIAGLVLIVRKKRI